MARKVLLEECVNNQAIRENLNKIWKIDGISGGEIIECAMAGGKHSEFYMIAQQLNLSEEQVRMDVVRAVADFDTDARNIICQNITDVLEC